MRWLALMALAAAGCGPPPEKLELQLTVQLGCFANIADHLMVNVVTTPPSQTTQGSGNTSFDVPKNALGKDILLLLPLGTTQVEVSVTAMGPMGGGLGTSQEIIAIKAKKTDKTLLINQGQCMGGPTLLAYQPAMPNQPLQMLEITLPMVGQLQPGDVAVLAIGVTAGLGAVINPSGWVRIGERTRTDAGRSFSMVTWARKLDAADLAAQQVIVDFGELVGAAGIVAVFRNVSFPPLAGNLSGGNAGPPYPVPSIMPLGPKTLAVVVCGKWLDLMDGVGDPPPAWSISDMTKIDDQQLVAMFYDKPPMSVPTGYMAAKAGAGKWAEGYVDLFLFSP